MLADHLRSAASSRRVVFALLLAGLALRLWGVTLARFDRDEAGIWVIALDIAEGRSLPVVGGRPSGSEGGLPGTLLYFLAALFQLATKDPLASAAAVAVFNAAGLWAVHRALAAAWSAEAALAWLLLTVAAPGSVTFADRYWTPNFGLPILAAVLLGLVRTIQGRHGPATALAVFVLLVAPQVHLSCVQLWLLAPAILLVERRAPRRRELVIGLAAGLLVYAPYAIGELATGFDNTRKLLQGAGGTPRAATPGALLALLYLFLGQGTPDPSYLVVQGQWGGFDPVAFWAGTGPGDTARFYGRAAPLLFVVQASGWVLVAAGLVVAARALRGTGPGRLPARILFLALGCIVLLFALTGRGGFAHYVAFLAGLGALPVVFAVLAAQRSRLLAPLALAYLLLAPVAGLLARRPHYEVDPRESIPQQEAVVRYVLAAVPPGQTFELHTAFPEGKPVTYALLAQRWAGARWLAAERAREVFTVVPRAEAATARVPGRVVGVLRLRTLVLVHSRR